MQRWSGECGRCYIWQCITPGVLKVHSSSCRSGSGVVHQGAPLFSAMSIVSLLQGPGTMEFAADMRPYFKKVAWQRPKATRSESKEVYLIGLKCHSPSDLSASA